MFLFSCDSKSCGRTVLTDQMEACKKTCDNQVYIVTAYECICKNNKN